MGILNLEKTSIYLDEEFSEQNKSRMHQLGDVIKVHTVGEEPTAVIGENRRKSNRFCNNCDRPIREILDSIILQRI